MTDSGCVVSGAFTVQPAWWAGGGFVRGAAWCRAPAAGLHAAALRLVCCTATVRPLCLLADSLHYSPDHVTIQAHDKNYDICSEDDPACEYYVHLGTAFPNRGLSATVLLVNHSPIVYSYYWSIRPWGVCSCWLEESQGSLAKDDALCVGAVEARDKELAGEKTSEYALEALRVEPGGGRVAPRSTCAVRVFVPDAGARLGVQRAVLMLILRDVPRESFLPNFDPMIVSSKFVESPPFPGVKPANHEVCEVVSGQLEVWWEVVPVRFVLDPPILMLTHSRRINSIDVTVRATQLYGCDMIQTSWELPVRVPTLPDALLTPANSCATAVMLTLPSLPNEYPETDVIRMVAENKEWSSLSMVTRQTATRHPRLSPARFWLGVVPPTTTLRAHITVHNDTHQHICWWAEGWRWLGESPMSAECQRPGRVPCTLCQERPCTCSMLRPARGALYHDQRALVHYNVNAPERDTCVTTLVQVRRTSGDVCRVAGGAGTEGRAVLVAYRVLAPRLALRVLPCLGDKKSTCKGCQLDAGAGRRGVATAVLRPSAALPIGNLSCYRLQITNITPIATSVQWEPPLEGDDVLSVSFFPNEFPVEPYGQVTIQVVLEARRVCGRRLYVCRALFKHARAPLYLVIDVAISGLNIICELPLGSSQSPSTTLIIKRTQHEVFPWEPPRAPPSAAELFEEDDRRRLLQKENICRCRFKMMWVDPPPKRPLPPGQYHPIDIITEPPPLTRVCPCEVCAKLELPAHTDTYCLQYTKMPLATVHTRTITLRNVSVLDAAWRASVRRWPRLLKRTLAQDKWAAGAQEPGVAVQLQPASGRLARHSIAALDVHVYADSWGLYRDQILIQVENVEPIIVDLWMEALGPPLQFALTSSHEPPVIWMSSSDPQRTVRARNTTRSRLDVRAYLLQQHDHKQNRLPFRLYLRFLDTPPPSCPCLTAFDSDSLAGEDGTSKSSSSYSEEMDTIVEVFLAADFGLQRDTNYQVEPLVTLVEPGEQFSWTVTLTPLYCEMATDAVVMLRCVPVDFAGEGWYRPEPSPQKFLLRQAERGSALRAAAGCEVRVRLCALHLPCGDVLRVRKRFRIQNIGNGPLSVWAETSLPWQVVREDASLSCGCGRRADDRSPEMELLLQPRSSTQVCVEVCVDPAEVAPDVGDLDVCQAPPYIDSIVSKTPIVFNDQYNTLLTLQLVLEMEYPILHVEPAVINFGFVTDGDTRKSYFTVRHTSREETINVEVEWCGAAGYTLFPLRLTLAPGTSERVYVQYISKWCGAPAEGCARVSACAAGAAWCRAGVACRTAPSRDYKCHITGHDYTDDTHLLPPECAKYHF